MLKAILDLKEFLSKCLKGFRLSLENLDIPISFSLPKPVASFAGTLFPYCFLSLRSSLFPIPYLSHCFPWYTFKITSANWGKPLVCLT